MERTPNNEPKRRSDDELINDAVMDAGAEERPIEHAAARMIASQLHSGQDSALYAFTSTGAIIDGLTDELLSELGRQDYDSGTHWAIEALDEYVYDRLELDQLAPVEGWSQLWLRGEQ